MMLSSSARRALLSAALEKRERVGAFISEARGEEQNMFPSKAEGKSGFILADWEVGLKRQFLFSGNQRG